MTIQVFDKKIRKFAKRTCQIKKNNVYLNSQLLNGLVAQLVRAHA